MPSMMPQHHHLLPCYPGHALPADYVADLSVFSEKHCLLSVSGDGTLAVVDLRKNKARGPGRGCLVGQPQEFGRSRRKRIA